MSSARPNDQITLTQRHAPKLRLDLRGLLPAVLAPLADDEIERLTVGHGTQRLPLAELFAISRQPAEVPTLRLVGDLSRADRIGWGLDSGLLLVDGNAGDHAGALMTGGELRISGSAGLLAGCQMAGGQLTVAGNVGDHAASGLPGSMDGMRGGQFIVHGNAGHRLADRMRRGTLVVLGDAGDHAASRMVAGTLVLAGRFGANLGFGLRRGSLVLLSGAGYEPPSTWVPAQAEAPVFWQLLARQLAGLGGLGGAAGPLAGLPQRRISRHLGDLAVDGRGEIIVPH